mgnify:CR=1 FL=1
MHISVKELLLFFLVFAVVFVSLAHIVRRFFDRPANNEEILAVGGAFISGQEAFLSTFLSAIIVISVVVQNGMSERLGPGMAVMQMLEWRDGAASPLKPSNGARSLDASVLSKRLMDTELAANQPALMELLSEVAHQIGDNRDNAQLGFSKAFSITSVMVGVLIIIAALQIFLLSWHLTGLRILMPIMLVWTILAFVYLAATLSASIDSPCEDSICQPFLDMK